MVKITKNINSSLSAPVHTQNFIPPDDRPTLKGIAQKIFSNKEVFGVSKTHSFEQLFQQNNELGLAWKLTELFNPKSPTTLKRVINFYYRRLKHRVRWCGLSSDDKQKVKLRVNQLMRDKLNGYCKFNDRQKVALRQEIKYSIVKTLSDNKSNNKSKRKIALHTPAFEEGFNQNLSPAIRCLMHQIEILVAKNIYPIFERSEESSNFTEVIEKYEKILTQNESSSICNYYQQLTSQKKARLAFLGQSLCKLKGEPCKDIIEPIFKIFKDIHALAMDIGKPQEDSRGEVILEREKVLEIYIVIILKLAKSETNTNQPVSNLFIPDLIQMAGTYVEDFREHDHYGFYSSAQANLETALAFIYQEVAKQQKKKT